MTSNTEPEIHCSHNAVQPVEQLIENPRNPNTHPEAQLQLLGKVIQSQGWRQPIVVSKRSGFIVKGHGRYQAALAMGFKQVPVDVQEYTNEAQEWADLIADNRLAELAELDRTSLKNLIEEIDTGSIDIELTGYSERALEALMTEVYQGDDVNLDEFFEPDPNQGNDENTKIVLEYTPEDYERVIAKFGELEGSKEKIVMQKLGLE